MPDPLLTFLKYIFLAALYLFFLRVLRAVWIELREPKAAGPAPTTGPAPMPPSPAAASGPPVAALAGAAGPHLVVLRGDHQGREFAVGDELTVGRAGGCGVALPDDTFVSQLHARVYRRDGRVYLEDLGSTNGTFVNDRKVTGSVPLGPGDQLKVGRTTLELRP